MPGQRKKLAARKENSLEAAQANPLRRVKQGKDCEIMKTLVENENPGGVAVGFAVYHHHHGLVGEAVVTKESAFL